MTVVPSSSLPLFTTFQNRSKRSPSRLVTALTLLSVLIVSPGALAQDVTLMLGTLDGQGQTSIVVPIELTAGGGTASTIFLDVDYEYRLFEVNSVQAGASALAAGKDVSYSIVTPGTLRVVVGAMNTNTIGAGTLANIEFDIYPFEKSASKAGAPNFFPVIGMNASAADPAAAALTISVDNGGVLVNAAIAIAVGGLVVFLGLSLLLVVLGVRRAKHVVASGLCLTLILIPFTEAFGHVAGDMDSSGIVDATDIQIFTSTVLADAASALTDLDLSGATSARDYQLLVNIALGADLDSDDDGLIDDAEDNIGSNPNESDTDGDGEEDGDEIIDGTDPIVPPSPVANVFINEFVASNDAGLLDLDATPQDWVELYNGGTNAVSLQGWALTDDATDTLKWVFPDVTINAGEFLVIFCSDKNLTTGPELHTSFKLKRTGEYLGLYNDAQTVVSEFAPLYDEQVLNLSYGRFGAGPGFRYFNTPTPGAHNLIFDETFTGFVDGFNISPPRGFYETPFNITMGTTTPGETIRYTTDGTEPTELNGMDYTTPIPVSGHVALRARAFVPGFLPSQVETHTYIYAAPAAQKALPTFALVADPTESLYEPNGIMSIVGGQYVVSTFGILAWQQTDPSDIHNPSGHGILFERPSSFELIYPADNSGFQLDAGIRISGSDFHRDRYRRDPGADWTTFGPFQNMASYNKFSFRMYFRGDYGPPKLVYPLFEGVQVTSFDKVVLRGGHNDGYNPFMKDELSRRLMLDMGQVVPRGILANLFINGEYKAYYNVTERIDEDFLRSWHNTTSGFDIMGQPANALSGGWEVNEGDDLVFVEMLDFAAANDLSVAGNYQFVSDRLDIANFIDYLMNELYTGNDDWPNRNWIAARERVVGGKFRYYVWDSEGSFGGSTFGADNSGTTGLNNYPFWGGNQGIGGGGGLKNEDTPLGTLYRALVANAGFRAQFAARAQALLGPGGPLDTVNVTARYEALRDEMVQVRPGFDTYIEDTWIPIREAVVIGALTTEGLY